MSSPHLHRFALVGGGLLWLVMSVAVRADTPTIPANEDAPRRKLRKISFSIGMCDLYLLAQKDVQTDLRLSRDQVLGIRVLVVDTLEKKRTLAFADYLEELKQNQKLALGLRQGDKGIVPIGLQNRM